MSIHPAVSRLVETADQNQRLRDALDDAAARIAAATERPAAGKEA